MKDLCILEEEVVTRSENTDRLNKSQTTPSYLIDNIDQSTMEALEQDMRTVEDMREEILHEQIIATTSLFVINS